MYSTGGIPHSHGFIIITSPKITNKGGLKRGLVQSRGLQLHPSECWHAPCHPFLLVILSLVPNPPYSHSHPPPPNVKHAHGPYHTPVHNNIHANYGWQYAPWSLRWGRLIDINLKDNILIKSQLVMTGRQGRACGALHLPRPAPGTVVWRDVLSETGILLPGLCPRVSADTPRTRQPTCKHEWGLCECRRLRRHHTTWPPVLFYALFLTLPIYLMASWSWSIDPWLCTKRSFPRNTTHQAQLADQYIINGLCSYWLLFPILMKLRK